MKRIHFLSILLAILFIFTIPVAMYAQRPEVGSALRQALSENSWGAESRDVLLVFEAQVDLMALKEEMDMEASLSPARPQRVMRACMQVANASQDALLSDLRTSRKQSNLDEVRRLWIVNAMVLPADRATAQWLLDRPDLAFVDLNNAWRARLLDAPRSAPLQLRVPGGREPGLSTINAPALWAMGYTGKGRISFSIDTGVWPHHRAIRERFLAHFVPMTQAWFPYDFAEPADKSGSHGTHTIGTTLGLDRSTDDTIGVAFNAYWIASDPVATSLATVKPLSDFMYAFEWSMNPDGDTATSHDVPDVINNSWGYDSPGDTSLCVNSFVAQTLSAVEAAGIAAVFSAGNDGPGTGTISEPHHIASGLVNTFTVGAVNHHQSGNPIAGFSSRGPTNCPVTGSLLIKPEVCAPGVSVRSCVGDSLDYAAFQGTSMAAPHVTGAVLLLKEAFPSVTGQEILEALYFSATDLGNPGEDNDYGMGLIDVLAAFNYLAQSHTPVPPLPRDYDLAIQDVLLPEAYTCDSAVAVRIAIENRGDSSIANAVLELRLDGGSPLLFAPSGPWTSGQRDTFDLPQVLMVTGGGQHVLFLQLHPDSAITDCDTLNNRRYHRFRSPLNAPLPFNEDFEQTALPGTDWQTADPDNDAVFWDTAATAGLSGSQYSAVLPLFNHAPRALQKDDLLSPAILMPDTGSAFLSFDVAYQFRGGARSDSLKVFLSQDCRETWPNLLYKQGGAGLSTHNSIVVDFVPTVHTDWRTEVADMSPFVGMGQVHLKFQGINNSGNNLYVDNINIASAPVLGHPGMEAGSVLEIFPNPNDGVFNLRWQGAGPDSRIAVSDLLGNSVFQAGLVKGKAALDLQFLPAGLYIVEGKDGARRKVRRFLKR